MTMMGMVVTKETISTLFFLVTPPHRYNIFATLTFQLLDMGGKLILAIGENEAIGKLAIGSMCFR